MFEHLLVSPPVALGVFLLLAYGLYRLGGALAAVGHDAPGKREPYACGEDLPAPEERLTYRAFFRLALMFAVLHLAAIVVSTVGESVQARRLAAVYLVGIAVSLLALSKGDFGL